MLPNKGTKTISELKNYFGSNEKSIQTLFTEFRSLKISDKIFQSVDKPNTQYTCFQKFIFLILFPLFEIKDISHYDGSSLYPLFKCGKDVFYRFIEEVCPELPFNGVISKSKPDLYGNPDSIDSEPATPFI
jgi:hypothetical protein